MKKIKKLRLINWHFFEDQEINFSDINVCIHTSQGMEFAYTGLIIGDDLFFKDGKIETDYTKHPKGAAEFKRPHQHSILPKDAQTIDRIIRNTYKVLFTRGQVGLYLYVMDKPLREYLKQKRKELLMIKD